MTVMMLHIPRTGGTSRAKALADISGIVACPHQTRLSDVGPDDVPVVYVRDPVTRYLSALDHLRTQPPDPFPAYEQRLASSRRWLLRPQTWWLDDLRDDAIILDTATMDRTLPVLTERYAGVRVSVPHLNASRVSLPSGSTAEMVRELYAGDYALYNRARVSL